MGNQNRDTLRQVACFYCKRQGYHFKHCPIVLWKKHNKGKLYNKCPYAQTVPYDVFIWKSRKTDWWDDPILSKQWGNLEDMQISAQVEALFFSDELT